jgi:hypothetical protein
MPSFQFTELGLESFASSLLGIWAFVNGGSFGS